MGTDSRAQSVWSGVIAEAQGRAKQVWLSPSEKASVRRALSHEEVWDCGKNSRELMSSLFFGELPVAPGRVVLVEAGQGCARGGQGANGAMWIMRLEAGRATVLATQQHGFEGWLFRIGSPESHGYRDVIVGWHKSAFVAGLTYFRFNGRQYLPISSAEFVLDDEGNDKILTTKSKP